MPADLMMATTVLLALGLREILVLAIKKFWKKAVDTDYVHKVDFDNAMKEVVTAKDCSVCQERHKDTSKEITRGIDGLGKSIDDLRGMFLVVIMNSDIKVDAEIITQLAKRG